MTGIRGLTWSLGVKTVDDASRPLLAFARNASAASKTVAEAARKAEAASKREMDQAVKTAATKDREARGAAAAAKRAADAEVRASRAVAQANTQENRERLAAAKRTAQAEQKAATVARRSANDAQRDARQRTTAHRATAREAENAARRQAKAEDAVQREMRATEQQSKRTQQVQDQHRRSNGRLASSMGALAKRAAAVGAAYVSIQGIKNAVSSTEDLAKVTMGLANNYGMAADEASRWAAQARVRGIDAGKLSVGFNSLSKAINAVGDADKKRSQAMAKIGRDEQRRVEQLAGKKDKDGGTKAAARESELQRKSLGAQADAFAKLGISVEQVKAAKGDLSSIFPEIADGMEKLGAGSERNAVGLKLFGRQWQTFRPLLSGGSAALREQLELADKYGITLQEADVKGVAKMAASQREWKLAMLGLETTIGRTLLPVIGKLQMKIADLTVKAQKYWPQIRREIEPIAEDIEGAVEAVSSFVARTPEVLKIAGALLKVGLAVKAIKFAGSITGISSLISGVGKLQRATRGPGGVMGGAASAAAATSAVPVVAGAPAGGGRAGRREGRPLGMLGTWQMTRGLGGTRREASAESIRRALGRVPLPPVRGVAGALAAGGVGAAVSGGSVLGGAASGAAMGAIGGPWGMAAGAAAGAGITAIVNQFRKAGTERAEKAGRAFAERVTGRTEAAAEAGLRPAQAARFGEARARIDAAEQILQLERRARQIGGAPGQAVRDQGRTIAKGAGLDYNAVVANRSNALNAARQTVGQQVKSNLAADSKQYRFFDERKMRADMERQLALLPPTARAGAQRTMVEWARSVEREGRLPKGATARLIQVIGKAPEELPAKFSHHAKAAVDAMDSQLEDRRVVRTAKRMMDALAKLTPALDIKVDAKTLPESVAKMRTQLDILRKTARDKSLPKELRAEAERQLPGLSKAYDETLSRMAWRMGLSKDEADKWARGASRAARRAGDSADQVKVLQDAVRKLEARMGTSKDTASKLVGSFRDIGMSAKDAKARVDELMKAPKPASGSLLDWGDVPEFSIPKPKKAPKGATGGRLTSGGFRRFAAGGLAVAAMMSFGAPAFGAGGMVPALVSSGEVLRYPGGQWAQVPGPRVAADNVAALLPVDTEVYTDHGQSLLAAGLSRAAALRDQMPHFAKGGTVRGKVSWFGGARDSGDNGQTASGISQSVPGVAIRPGKTYESGRPYLRGYWRVTIGGRSAVLQQTDLGPHEKTGRRIDVLSSALGKLGYTERNFPTDAQGSAAWLGKSKKAAAAAKTGKTSSSGDTVSYTVNRRYGRSSTRGGLLDDAYSAGYSGVEAWGSRTAARRAGVALGVGEIRDALDSAKDSYTRRVEIKSKAVSFGKSAAKGRAGAGWLRPVAGGTLTSGYGARSSPGGKGSTNHDGVDIGVPTGTPVRAAKAGRVTAAGPRGGYGNYVRLAHANNVQTFYGHLSKIGVTRGQRVARGAQIALSGNTGTSTGPHLHFGAASGGRSINPASLMRFRRGGVARLSSGGKVATTLGAVRQSASQGRLEAFGAAIEAAAVERVERLRDRLLREVRGGGDRRSIDRVRAALSQIQADLAGRVQESLMRAGAVSADWERKTGESQHWMRRAGVDPSSSRGLSIQRINAETYLRSQSGSELAGVNQAIRGARANLKGATSREEREAARAKLSEAQDKKREILGARTEAKTLLAELERQLPQIIGNERLASNALAGQYAQRSGSWAAQDAVTLDRKIELERQLQQARDAKDETWQSNVLNELAQVDESIKAAGERAADRALASIDADATEASLTESKDDDIEVERRRRDTAQIELDKAREARRTATNDEDRARAEANVVKFGGIVKAATDAIEGLNTSVQELADRQQENTDLLKALVENQNKLLNGSAASRDAIVDAIGAAASGYIGGSAMRGNGAGAFSAGGWRA